MFQVNPGRVGLWAVALCGAVASSMISSAPAQMTQPLTLKDVVAKADQIVVAQCVERKIGVRDGRIITQYKVKPSEFWKGERALTGDGTFLMSEYGGSLAGKAAAPIAQFAPGSVNMAPGEDVLLFLANPGRPASPKTRSVSGAPRGGAVKKNAPQGRPGIALNVDASPRVVGMWQGRYNVITNPQDGSRMIAQPGISAVPGAPVNAEMRQATLRARGLKVARSADGADVVVRDDSVRLTPDKVQQLNQRISNAVRQSRKDHEALVKESPKAAQELYPMQTLDSAKATILKLVKETRK